jgi:outer membrane immunogenic protein
MQTKTMLLASAAGAALIPTAQAADLPLKGPAMVRAPAVSPWAGWYIGAHLGGAAQHNSWWEDDYAGSSFIAGGQIGYNWQRGNFVYGIEADGSWLSKGKEVTEGFGSSVATYGTNITWLATVRGRMGLVFGDTMAYVTGGLAFGEIETKEFGTAGFGGPGRQWTYSETRVGWVIGGGVEHMLTPRWTIGVEGLFVDFGHFTNSSPGNGKSGVRVYNSALIGRFKANYRF